MKLAEHVEGRTRIIVPAVSLSRVPPPTSPVFFNPAASLNRDVSVAMTAVTKGATFCDSMAGVGSRGVRVANEVGRELEVTLVDFNPGALRLARRSAARNSVSRRCEFVCSETSSYLFSRYGKDKRFGYVDVDPFGSPVRQLQAALCATQDGGTLSVTATDTAVLSGVYPRVASKRYGAVSMNNQFNHETGIRILAGAVARTAAQLDIGAEPVVGHSTRHYLRLFLRISAGASRADSALRNLGHVGWCPACGHAWSPVGAEGGCERCGSRAKTAGPLWTGGITDSRTVELAERFAAAAGLSGAAEVLGSQRGVDRFPPWSFSIERACSALKMATVPEAGVFQALARAGFSAMRTPFERTGVKTDAPHMDFLKAVGTAPRLALV